MLIGAAFNILLLPVDRPSIQNLNREILELTGIINQIDSSNIYRTFHQYTKKFIFSLAPQGTFSKTDHTFGHKAILNRHKEIEITPCIILDQNGIKLDMNNRNYRNLANSCKLNNSILNKNSDTKETSKDTGKMEITPCILPDYYELNLDINSNRNYRLIKTIQLSTK